LESRAEVGSSRINMSGSLRIALAIANLCLSHPDNLSHFSHTSVSNQSSSFSIKSRISAFLQASFICSKVASSFIYLRLCRIVSLNTVVSWNTAANLSL